MLKQNYNSKDLPTFDNEEMLNALNNMAVAMFPHEEKSFEECIDEGLLCISEIAKIDAATVYLYDKDKDHFKMIFLWYKGNIGLDNIEDNLKRLDPESNEYAWLKALVSNDFILPKSKEVEELKKRLINDHEIIISAIEKPGSDVEHMERFGAKAVMYVPIILKGEFWGVITLEDHTNYRNFEKENLDLLYTIAHLCSGAIIRANIEKRNNEQKLQLQAIIDAVPHSVFCKDLSNTYTLYNKFFQEYCGIDEFEGIGKKSEDILEISFDEINNEVIRTNQKNTVVVWIKNVKGYKRLFEINEVPFVVNNKVIGIVGIANDITEYKEMEEEALQASRTKSAFLANMSHELRTPLNVVIGLTELTLEETNIPDNIRDNLNKISNAGSTLLNIVDDILDISKIESGKFSFMPTEYSLASLISDISTWVNVRIGEKDVVFHLCFGQALPSRLKGDPLRIKQILNNLLSNAVKHTNEGIVELGITITPIDETIGSDYWVDLYVKDTGEGMKKEDCDLLFTDYYQVDNQANRKYKGTGLGLSITKRLVELLDGYIAVESEYKVGTVFKLRFKQGYVDESILDTTCIESLKSFEYKERKKEIGQTITRVALENKRVLIVDDMVTNIAVAAGLLKKYKMKVDGVVSGEEAIDIIKKSKIRYDAIFMDHMMPGMDGIETTVAIRKIDTEYAKKIPIIALTANAIQGASELFLSSDFQDYVSKPIDKMQLDYVVKRWLC